MTGAIDTSVTWSAIGGSISSAGLSTAPSVLGTYEVKAQSVANTAKSATATVTVKPKPYSIVNLGLRSASGLNSAGDVVGQKALVNGQLHAALWQNGTKTDLGTLGGTLGGAQAINDAGQIVGFSVIGAVPAPSSGRTEPSPTSVPSGSMSIPTDINNNGAVVGNSTNGTDGDGAHPFLWQNGTMTDLGRPPRGSAGWAVGINTAGQVAGS